MARNIEVVDGVPCRRIAGGLWLQVPVAAEYAAVSQGTVRNWSSAGRLRIRKFGRCGFVSKAALDALLVGNA